MTSTELKSLFKNIVILSVVSMCFLITALHYFILADTVDHHPLAPTMILSTSIIIVFVLITGVVGLIGYLRSTPETQE